jgi:hypothetical protein
MRSRRRAWVYCYTSGGSLDCLRKRLSIFFAYKPSDGPTVEAALPPAGTRDVVVEYALKSVAGCREWSSSFGSHGIFKWVHRILNLIALSIVWYFLLLLYFYPDECAVD